MDVARKKVAVAAVSVASNTLLVAGKVVVGLLIGSVAVVSEAAHSAVDLLAALIALWAVRASDKPPDDKHPFGHGKFENLSGTIEALLIFVAAGWILYEAAHKAMIVVAHIRAGTHVPEQFPLAWGVGVMAVSAVVNIFVSRLLFKVGNETDSVALKADAWHLRTDVWTSLGVMAALAVIWAGDLVAPQLGSWLHLVDPLAAALVAALIFRAAWNLTISAARGLMDEQLPPDEERWIRELIAQHRPVVRGFHHLRTRKSGRFRFIEFHLFVESSMSVERSHELAHDLAHHMQEHFPQSSVNIHVEPCDGDCRRHCGTGCFLSDVEREDLRRAAKPPEPGAADGPGQAE
jgi:cation diffusion facilitator family transporter